MENSIHITDTAMPEAMISTAGSYEAREKDDGLWVHELVAQQAVSSPTAIAVRSEKQQLTFGELDARANRLARHIQDLGVSAETPVALYFERSIDFVVAAFAVLKAGGAYVPLDSAYPPGRIDSILKDADVQVLLSHKWMAANLAAGPWKTVHLDFDAPVIDSYSAEHFSVEITGHNLAYIIYTSGSTGQPKGVEVTHANLLHLIRWHRRAFSVTPFDRASQFAGLAFDAAVWEVWCHLACGVSLHLIDEASRRSPEALKEWLVAEKITIAFVPTILAEQLITLDWPQGTKLRILLTGADTLHRYPKAGLPFTLINNYGPTECTVLVTSGPVRSEEANGHMPTLGQPIDDTEILLMDEQMKQVASGEEGELCVAGPQIARGYRNLPGLTAEKFVRENGTGRRIYRTGDRGRVLADGQIAFAGRMDDQIKIRGFRVEPDEIVAQLNSYAGILNSVVVSRGNDVGEKTLVAYLVLAAGVEITARQVKEHLQSRLPDYMIPASYVTLASLPLTTTGKCDKQDLPAPSAANRLMECLKTASVNAVPEKQTSHNGTQTRISQLVTGLMEGKAIGPDDNFFLVGGHSLMAAQLIARVRETLAVSLNLRQLFEAPTIASLAAAVDRKLATQ